VGERHLDRPQAVRGAPADLVGRGLGVLARQARHTHEPLRVVRAELGEPVVVRTHHRRGHFGIGDRVGHAEHAVQHLADDAVAVLRGESQRGIGRVRDAACAVVPEAGLVHAVEASGFTPSVRSAGVPRAAHLGELVAVRVDPERAVVSFDHPRHAVAPRDRRPLREEVGWQERQVDVPVGRDHRMRQHARRPPRDWSRPAPTLGH
jgi:hypothetical protein